MSEESGARGVVVAHGDMAAGLVDAVRRIAGDAADSLTAVSNEGKSPAELKDELEALLDSEPLVIFVDLQSGSCGMAAFTSCRERDRTAVVCGVNLPLLLDFVFHREMPLDELVPRLLRKGRDGIQLFPRAG